MPETSNFQIVKLQPERWQEFRALRLEALKLHPQTFVSLFEEEVEFSPSQWQDFLTQDKYEYLFVQDNRQNNLVGMGALVWHPGKKYTHMAELGSVFIKAEFRRQKAFTQLLHSLEEVGKKRGVEKLISYCGKRNIASVSAYLSNGFEIVGNLSKQMKNNGEYFDEYLLEKFL
ncbi:GNAT family N-acetyltransferase [Lusitaniella coriacea LEGE 07157]|uniref:GNAT family N-acetyltransferase n=1 Tax=Lusitaniella coriacea LEGE 07157 TaxID=945747 RepID=A0A8J7IWI9_9CYAN|nr:GNAT family N-acetyltransferase [Lusitaniella coriacea]MBE9118078.1 GNAT family N-acetyltransferase [Lusitaniella coriacea LEGE 07157]